VLYARGGSMKQSEKFTLFYKQLQEMGVQRINSGPVFNKWDVLKNLKKNAKIAPHLPDTMIFTAANDLKLMFNKYDVLYLKACRGRKGHQVIRIKKLLANYFEYRYYRGSKLNKGFVNFVNLMQLVHNFLVASRF
jgi:glutathione synthase/RimK-type ligase-like ATP-grasp enzyme